MSLMKCRLGVVLSFVRKAASPLFSQGETWSVSFAVPEPQIASALYLPFTPAYDLAIHYGLDARDPIVYALPQKPQKPQKPQNARNGGF